MKNKEEKYCYLTPDFPKEAFIIVVLFKSTKIPVVFIPLSNVIEKIEEADKCIEDFIVELSQIENKYQMEVIEYSMIVPITLEKYFL